VAQPGADPFHQLQAQVLVELGRAREAARMFDTIAVAPLGPATAAVKARHKTWNLTHRAAALSAAGDNSALFGLADTIEAAGRQSRYGRDWRLHHHVRGLLFAARGQKEAAAAEFRKAIFSTTSGYTRTNLELARVLLQLDRAREAVSVLQPAFRGPLEASNLYVTRTELHELLGRAWEAVGQPDSAAAHYQRVLQGWRNADPEFHARRDAARGRLIAMGRLDK
jgi:tetratricopeptide (TPR) repeat protein